MLCELELPCTVQFPVVQRDAYLSDRQTDRLWCVYLLVGRRAGSWHASTRPLSADVVFARRARHFDAALSARRRPLIRHDVTALLLLLFTSG